MKFLFILIFFFAFASCSNDQELQTGEIKTLQLLKKTIEQANKQKSFIDSRKLLSRSKIDELNIPILFVKLKSGQNGTLTRYPGENLGETWIGADGALIILDQGVLKASRGLGDDLMGAVSSIPPWSQLTESSISYKREVSYLSGNNETFSYNLNCKIKKNRQKEIVTIWGVDFKVSSFEENCIKQNIAITNLYYLDEKGIVRRSLQYHGETIGQVIFERLDR